MELTLTRRNLSSYTVTVVRGELAQKLLSQDVANITVQSDTPIDFMVGDRAVLLGSWYYINRLPKLEKGNGYTYEVELEGEMYRLRHAQFLLYDNTGMAVESDFSFMGSLEDIARLAISNLNRVYGSGAYLLGDCPQTDTRNHIINNENVLAVLQRVCSDYGYEFELIRAGSVIELRIGTVGTIKSLSLQYGAGKGLYKLDRLMVNDTGIVTRLFVYGGNRNIPSGYRDFSRRLKLPNNPHSYIEDADAIATYGVIEGTKIFEDIYPRRTGVITEVGAPNAFTDSTMDFDLNETDAQGQTKYLIPGNPAKVSFISGNLAGYEFEIAAYSHASKSFTIKYYTDERGYKYPSDDDAFKLSVGDQYVLLDIYMPQSYIDAAEAELLSQATSLLAEKKSAKVRYSVEIDPIFAKQECINLNAGDIIRVRDTDLNIDRDIRVVSVKRDLLEPYKMSLELGDEVTVSLATQLLDRTSAIEKVVKINQLHDPAKYRTAWRNALELQQMVFDQDGYFDTGNIKPLSITTQMLSVGSKAGAFVLNGIVFQPGFNGVANRITTTFGTLSHYAIENNIRTWNVAASDFLVPDNNARYIYVKCEITGNSATVLYSTDQIRVDDQAGYYTFLVGVLHSVQDGYRKISLTYGSTFINGKEITTGRISSQNGITYFDLDTGEIRGRIVFRSGNDDQTIENNISTAQSTASSAQIAAGNAQSAANTANALLADIASDNKFTPSEKQHVRREWEIIAAEKTQLNSQASTFGIVTENSNYNTKFQALADYLNNGTTWSSGIPLWINDSNISTTTNIVGSTFRAKFKEYYDARTALHNAITTKAKQLADAAQSTADTANTNALNRGNLLNWNGLRYKDYPIDTASYQDFASNIYGTTSENAIVSAIGPFGYETKVWEGKNVDGDSPSGGFYSRLVNISTTKKYMFVVWIRSLDDSVYGTVYLGTYPSRVRNVTHGSLDSNPYFASVYYRHLVKNRWYLFVGFINPDTYTGSTVSEATGIYDSVTRQRVNFDGTGLRNEYRFETGITQVFLRAFSYGVSTGVRTQFYGAGVYECNGNEPTIEQLLSGAYTGTLAVRPNDLNLKAYYTFDKSVTQDDSFNSKTLTIVGTVSRSNSYIKGKAARFDRTGYLVRDDSSLKTSEVTISCWIYFNTVSTGLNGIFSLSYSVWSNVNTTDYLTFSVYNGSSWVSITRKLTAQKWYHVVFQLKQGTGGYARMYINGILVGIEYSDTLQYNTNNILSIGVDYNNTDLYRFDGYIDDFRLYNYILADNEVLWLYTNPGAGIDYGAVKTVIDGGLVSSGTIMVGQGSSEVDYTVKAGMTGQGEDEGSIRFWAGAPFQNRANAPFRVLQNGELYATAGNLAGWKILTDRLEKENGLNKFIISPEDESIRFIYDGDDKVVLQNAPLPLRSDLVNPNTETFSLGIYKQVRDFIEVEQGIWRASGSILSSNSFTIPNSSYRVALGFYLLEIMSIYGQLWLADNSGTRLELIKAVSRSAGIEPIIFYEVSTLRAISSGTYRILFDYEITGNDNYNPVTIGYGGTSNNYFTYTQALNGTIIGSNGIATFWDVSKYLYVSHLESYFLQLLGSYKLMAGSNGIDCTSSRCILKGVNPHTERTYIPVGYSADVVISTYSFNVVLSYITPSYVAILPSYQDIQSKFGISGYFSIVLNIVIGHTSIDSVCRLYGYSTDRSSTNSYNYPAIINSNGNTIGYISVSRGDAVTLLLEYASDGYRAFILGLKT